MIFFLQNSKELGGADKGHSLSAFHLKCSQGYFSSLASAKQEWECDRLQLRSYGGKCADG